MYNEKELRKMQKDSSLNKKVKHPQLFLTAICIFVICLSFTLISCMTNKPPISDFKIKTLKEKTIQAIENCRLDSEEDTDEFLFTLHNNDEDNISTDELMEILKNRGYKEADIRKNFTNDVARVFLEEIFQEEFELFSIDFITVTRGGIKFSLEYLSNHMQLPNIASFVYVTESENSQKTHMFYKINYEFGYYDESELTNGRKIQAFY